MNQIVLISIIEGEEINENKQEIGKGREEEENGKLHKINYVN